MKGMMRYEELIRLMCLMVIQDKGLPIESNPDRKVFKRQKKLCNDIIRLHRPKMLIQSDNIIK